MALRLTVTLLAAIFALSGAQTSAPTAVPTSAPSAAPTSAPTTAPEPAGTIVITLAPAPAPTASPDNTAVPSASPTAAPTANETTAVTPAPTAAETRAQITFSLVLQTEALCSDMMPNSTMYASMITAGSKLAGDVNTSAVQVACSAARRLMSANLRRLQDALSIQWGVTLPSDEVAAAEAALSSVTVESAAMIFEEAGNSSGLTFTVDEAAIADMKASVTTVTLIMVNGTWTLNSSTTTTEESTLTETSAAAETSAAGSVLALAIAAFFIMAQ